MVARIDEAWRTLLASRGRRPAEPNIDQKSISSWAGGSRCTPCKCQARSSFRLTATLAQGAGIRAIDYTRQHTARRSREPCGIPCAQRLKRMISARSLPEVKDCPLPDKNSAHRSSRTAGEATSSVIRTPMKWLAERRLYRCSRPIIPAISPGFEPDRRSFDLCRAGQTQSNA